MAADSPPVKWPDGKAFAFTIFDDTDLATPGNFEQVYDVLASHGFRTTKSVWPISSAEQPARGPEGSTCEDADYLRLVLEIQKAGFEIGYHNSSHFGVERAQIIQALDRFRELFGHDPVTMANHQANPEAMYWGPARLSQPWRMAYRLARRGAPVDAASGHLRGSRFFWGDICRARIKYVRSFVYPQIDTLAACNLMPYFDPQRPYVNAWFASSFASWWPDFEIALSESNQDALEASGGVCILYTHFGAGFHDDKGKLHSKFELLMKRLSKKNGWFVPAKDVLDHLASTRGVTQLTWAQRQSMEWKWVKHKLTVRGTE